MAQVLQQCALSGSRIPADARTRRSVGRRWPNGAGAARVACGVPGNLVSLCARAERLLALPQAVRRFPVHARQRAQQARLPRKGSRVGA